MVKKAELFVNRGRENASPLQSDKKTLDDWELTHMRKDGSNPFNQILLNSIGDAANDIKGRASRINTTEIFESQNDLKSELGRQNEFALDNQTHDGLWEENFFETLEGLLTELVQ